MDPREDKVKARNDWLISLILGQVRAFFIALPLVDQIFRVEKLMPLLELYN